MLARRELDEGLGVITASLTLSSELLTNPPGLQYTDERFWVPNLPVFHRLYWKHQNACGTAYYGSNRDEYLLTAES